MKIIIIANFQIGLYEFKPGFGSVDRSLENTVKSKKYRGHGDENP